jgi:hypothetical protein
LSGYENEENRNPAKDNSTQLRVIDEHNESSSSQGSGLNKRKLQSMLSLNGLILFKSQEKKV